MSVAAKCRDSLQKFEIACRDKTINFETIQRALDEIFLINGEIPNDLETLELLDALADYFATACEEEVRRMVFHLLFPCGFNLNPVRERFLIKLTQLAICVGLTPLLEHVAVWLKGQIFLIMQAITATKDHFLLDDRLFDASRPVSNFVTHVLESLMSVHGFSETCKKLHETTDYSDPSILDNPLISLLRLSPLLVSALISAITLTYIQPFVQDRKEMLPSHFIVELLTIWLKVNQSPALRQDWTSIDWRGYFLSNPPRFLDISKNKGLDWPVLVSEAWHPARGLVWLCVLASTCHGMSDPLATALAELHCELIGNFCTPLNRNKRPRNSSGASPDTVPAMWRLRFPSDIVPLLDRLRRLPKGNGEESQADLYLLRVCELICVAWKSGRLFECDPEEIAEAMRPFATNRVTLIVLQAVV